jgi:hypothetical protein
VVEAGLLICYARRQRCGLGNVMHYIRNCQNYGSSFSGQPLLYESRKGQIPIRAPSHYLLGDLVHMLSRVEAECGGRPLRH